MPLISIVGPTASGKTSLGVELAARLEGELLNVDSMQVFRGLDVGTDKPTASQQQRVRIHGIDLIDPGESFDAASFADLGWRVISEASRCQVPVIAAGGTGLYHRALNHGLVDVPGRQQELRAALNARREEEGIEALYQELMQHDPDAAARIHPNDWVRIERALELYASTGLLPSSLRAEHGFREYRFRQLTFGCFRPREELYSGIEQRLEQMWRTGLLEETQCLLEQALDPERLPLKALGYRHAAAYLRGEWSRDEALALAKRDTKRYAKRQLTWYRACADVVWLRVPLDEKALQRLAEVVSAFLREECLESFDLPIVDAV
jgi:tRNA dimethylallyltransferase